MAVPTREQFFETWLRDFYFPEKYKLNTKRYGKLDPASATAETFEAKFPEAYRLQSATAREWILRGRLAGGVSGVGPDSAQEIFRPKFEQAYKDLLIAEAKKQEEEILRQQQKADQAAKELAAEQARIQAQLKAEQQAISQQQQQQAASIETQLKREREAATKEQAALKAQFETERAATEKLIGEAQAETERQQIAAKREATTALNIGKQTSLARLREQQKELAPVSVPQAQRRKTMIGQPGVASTRVSARPSIGGYGGTAAGRINPTGLNI